MLIYQTFTAFKEAIKQILTENFKIFKIDNFSGVLEVMIIKLDYIFAPIVLFYFTFEVE